MARMWRMGLVASVAACLIAAGPGAGIARGAGDAPKPLAGGEKAKLPDPPPEPQDKLMGEYVGAFAPAKGEALAGTAYVIGLKEGTYQVVLIASDGPLASPDAAKPAKVILKARLSGKGESGKVTFGGRAGDVTWTGTVADGRLAAEGTGDGGGRFDLKASDRRSPTEGAKPPQGAVVLLPYEPGKPTSLEAWTNRNWQPLADGSVLVRNGNNTTRKEFGDVRLHLEFYCPYMPNQTGQARANSGVYLEGKYEVQILDSFGLDSQDNDCGGIYRVSAPRVNACLPPGRWQTYDIVFRAPRYDQRGKVTELPTYVSVHHNGVLIQQDVKVPGVTTAGIGKDHAPTGPLMLQDHGNPVRYRNIWLVEGK